MVARMRSIVARFTSAPIVRETAERIVRGLPPRAYDAQASTLRAWLSNHVSFLRDPVGVELAYSPEKMLATIQASGSALVDCDDAAVLAAVLGRAIGLPARFRVLGFVKKDAPFSHVYAEVRNPVSGRWHEMDVTRSAREIPVHLITRDAAIDV